MSERGSIVLAGTVVARAHEDEARAQLVTRGGQLLIQQVAPLA
jgi:hypothetical protein